MLLLPPVGPKNKCNNFYLRSLEKPNPALWYNTQVVAKHSLTNVVKELLKSTELGGYLTNHSLCRSGTARLELTERLFKNSQDMYQMQSISIKSQLKIKKSI